MLESKVRPAPHAAGTSTAFAAESWIRALKMTAPIQEAPHRTFYVLLNELASRNGESPALLTESSVMSYGDAAALANRYAQWGKISGLEEGDRLCLLMPNGPEYLPIWAGLSGIGCAVALINTNLGGSSLAHCIDAAEPKKLIVAPCLVPALISAKPHLKSRPAVFAHGFAPEFPDVNREIRTMPPAQVAASEVTLRDPALFIYTSGTTGLPKAARVSHYRIMAWTHWFAGLMGIRPEDRLYNCLPMYHSIGGVAAPGAMLVGSGSVFIRQKFSAQAFWQEMAQYECTIFQYIGELCRYLLKVPPSEHEIQHRLRLCCGNGLSAEVWRQFQSRYKIPQIVEFYAATEGTFSLYNLEGVPGSIGRLPPFMPHSSQIELIKYDIENDRVLRGHEGYCIRCKAGEAGEAIGRISGETGGKFEGYTSQVDSEKKILRNVFKQGDAWFRTGDLMMRDNKGFFFFVDRIGDTFRWKGENVATSEVRDIISECPGIVDVTVYGVAVPGFEGRAGMAALVIGDGFNLKALGEHLEVRLPNYARPLFIRLLDQIDLTATFKHKKSDLVSQGFDPAKGSGELYFRDQAAGAYVKLDQALFDRLICGQIKL